MFREVMTKLQDRVLQTIWNKTYPTRQAMYV